MDSARYRLNTASSPREDVDAKGVNRATTSPSKPVEFEEEENSVDVVRTTHLGWTLPHPACHKKDEKDQPCYPNLCLETKDVNHIINASTADGC
ncbi:MULTISPECIES: hypothetical protein [Nitrosomonas]|uniref:Uncharacterized protein n=1 Tax=Nitrosomonas communis TaxID=44574 RepID=A0A0F7KFR5_9PROT|nr:MULTISPECIES: hypothetical protein [Nitrosomonas]AKH37993.1 hypothetical protein AAW31_09495 [Nitrosomonas communis]TYP91602.1 hypothetical protein BCL69_100830 [Nitrosomonas communis]UVS59879.1 hypothetical protein NX761_09975 [Nitrosomonas sp. PLL12]